MKSHQKISAVLALAAAAASAAQALAHPGPRVWIGSAAGQIVTYTSDNDLQPTTYTPSRVFIGGVDEDAEDSLPADGMLKEYPVPGSGIYATEFPGYQVRLDGQAGFGPSKSFGFDIAGPLLVYDAATHLFATTRKEFGTPGPAPQMSLSTSNNAITAQGPVSGFNFLSYTSAGAHGHLVTTLLGDGVNPVDGPQAVYAVPMKLTGSGLAKSQLYYVLFGRGIGYLDYDPNYQTFRDAAAAANATLTTETDWPGQWWSNANGNWSDATRWMPDVPDVPDLPAQFLSRITTPQTITVDHNYTVGSLVFDNANRYTLTGPGRLTLQMTQGPTAITVRSGSHTINAPLTLAVDAQIDISSASSNLTIGSDVTATGAAVTKTGAGTVEMKSLRAASLAISSGSVVLLANGSASGSSKLGALSITGGKLDLKDNHLVVTSSAVGTWTGSGYDGITGLIRAGRNGGSWNGSGIVTSMSTAVAGNLTTLGVTSAAQAKGIAFTATATWAGQTVTGSDTLVMYTYGGDANLDGKINVDDYTRIDFNVPLGVGGWYNGDFNYDGKINVDDYTIIDFNVGIQGPPFSTPGESSSLAAVPEPAGAFGLLCMLTALRRRSR